MVREITKTLAVDMDVADRQAFAAYAVDLLEETAGRVLGVLPSQDVALAEPEEDPRKAAIADQVEALLVQRVKHEPAKIGRWRTASETNSTVSGWWSPTRHRSRVGLGVIIHRRPWAVPWAVAQGRRYRKLPIPLPTLRPPARPTSFRFGPRLPERLLHPSRRSRGPPITRQ